MTRSSHSLSSLLDVPRAVVLCFLILLCAPSSLISGQSLSFSQLTATAPWDERSEAQIVLHPTALSYYPPTSTSATQSSSNSFILYGGRGVGHQYDNDVWLYDGMSSWTLIAGTNQFTNISASPASGPTLYTMHAGSALCADSTGNNLYVVSGFTYPAYYDKSSNGGVSWFDTGNSTATPLPFEPRSFPTCAVDPNSGTVYLMGGLEFVYGGTDSILNDVWAYSPSTAAWSQATDAAAWPARNALSSAAAYNSKLSTTLIYMAGGLTNTQVGYGFADPGDVGTSDVWVSSNGGVDWSRLNNDAFPVRELSRMAISPSGVIVMAEGADDVSFYPHDVWASVDGGVTWGQCSTNVTAPYAPRRNHAMAFDQSGNLWIMGGECYGTQCAAGGVKYNDVWKSAISFDDLSAVASACGVTVSPCGVGARCWPITGPCACSVPSSSSTASSSTSLSSSAGAASSTRAPVASSSSSTGSVVVNPTSAATPSSAATSTPASSSTTSMAPATSSSSAANTPTAASSSTPIATATSTTSASASGASSTPISAATSTTSASTATVLVSAGSSSSAAVVTPTSTSSSTGIAAITSAAALSSSSSSSSSSSNGTLGAPAPTSGSSSSGGGSGGLSAGAIVGIVVGVIAALLVLCVLWFMYSRYRKTHRDDSSPYATARTAARPADDTDSSESSNDMLSSGRPMEQIVQVWGTGELELNGSKQLSTDTSSQLGRTSSVSGRSDISGTADSVTSSNPSMSAVYVHD